MVARLWIPELASHSEVTLDAERSHYLCRVLRARQDEPIHCFDGTGTEFIARIIDPHPRQCRLALGDAVRTLPTPPYSLHLASACLKADLDLVMQKATELGVTDLWFLDTERSEGREPRQDRATRILRSACEQSGRVYLPRLHEKTSLDGFFDACNARSLLLTPGAPTLAANTEPSDFALLVGPEGGWTEAERRLASERGATEVGLGPLTLRANTAGLAALAALHQTIGWERIAL